MVGVEEDRIWVKGARGMVFCHTQEVGPNQKVEMVERLEGEGVGYDDECQAVFAAGKARGGAGVGTLRARAW
jgi:hypothetical protein